MSARCPICTTQLEDVDAIRRHTLVDHGIESEAENGNWAQVPGPPGAAGWLPDPWNAEMLRWWDGGQWSAQTSPLGSSPEPVTVAPPARRPGASPSGPFTAAALAVAVAMAIIVTTIAVTGGHSTHKPKNVVAAPATTPALPPAAPGARGGLAQAVLTADDLGGGWTQAAPAGPLPAAAYTLGPCNSPLWAHDVAGYQSQLQNGGGSVVQTEYLQSIVLEASSATLAGSQAGYVTSPSFVPCLQASIVAGLQLKTAGTKVRLVNVTADPLNLSVPMTSKGTLVSAVISDDTGQYTGAVISDDHVELFTGPYQGTLDIITCSCAPVSQADFVQLQTTRLAERLAALPPAGGLGATVA